MIRKLYTSISRLRCLVRSYDKLSYSVMEHHFLQRLLRAMESGNIYMTLWRNRASFVRKRTRTPNHEFSSIILNDWCQKQTQRLQVYSHVVAIMEIFQLLTVCKTYFQNTKYIEPSASKQTIQRPLQIEEFDLLTNQGIWKSDPLNKILI